MNWFHGARSSATATDNSHWPRESPGAWPQSSRHSLDVYNCVLIGIVTAASSAGEVNDAQRLVQHPAKGGLVRQGSTLLDRP